MVIRSSQMKTFQRSIADAFEARAAAHLRARFPDKLSETPPADLTKMIRAGQERANGYDIDYETDVIRYLEYMLEYGYDFDTNPRIAWAERILTAPDLKGNQRMERLDAYTTFELRP